MLIDSNIIIYAAQPRHADLRHWISHHAPVVSAVSYVEVLGYHRLTLLETHALELFFSAATILPIIQSILEEAVKLRQQKKMTLGDALIAATCLVHQLTLVTHNTKDFAWVTELNVFDPLENTA